MASLLADRGVTEPAVLHSDLPTNNWDGLAANLSGADSYLEKHSNARALSRLAAFSKG